MEFANFNQDETYANESNNTFETDGKSIVNSKPFSELSQNNNYIKIYVYQPYIRIRSVRLDANFSISVLNALYPANSTYIYNGQILELEKSFLHYNIQNENKIVLISSNMINSNPNFIKKWIYLTSRKDYFEEKINLNIKDDYRKEIARVKDVKLFKIESKKRYFGHYAQSQFKMQSKLAYWEMEISNESRKVEIDIDFDPLDCPSNDPLPIIW